MIEKINARIAELIKLRQDLINDVEKAKAMMFGYDVAIGELQHLLIEEKPETTPT